MFLSYIAHDEYRVDRGQITRTLIFPISALNLFVFTFLHLTFKYTSALGFVETGDFKDLGRVEPRV